MCARGVVTAHTCISRMHVFALELQIKARDYLCFVECGSSTRSAFLSTPQFLSKMNNLTMHDQPETPTTFFRVESDSSRARYRTGRGIKARTTSGLPLMWSCPDIREMVLSHLDWYSTEPSPWISLYSDQWRAEEEAQRRVNNRHRDVVIWVIDTSNANGATQYRNLRKFAKKGGFWIPKVAWHNSEHEWLFFNRIPESMIVGEV